jgi:hypothetical protein
MSASELQLDLGTVTMKCTNEEVAATLAALLGEMRAVIPKLREDERDILRQIMAQDNGALTVGELFPDFARESEGHKTLRRLRAAQFIRPALTGRWDPQEAVEIKPFARLMWDRVGEDTIFDGIAAAPAATPVNDVVDLGLTGAEEPPATSQPAVDEQPVEEDVVDLGAVEEEKESEPPVPARRSAVGSNFEDDNVLDVGDLDDLYAYAQEEVRSKG